MSIRTSSEMDYSLAGEHFPVLQLQKWSPSRIQLNLSEFREAFMSPTRQMILLLSYRCEALLLPLLSGNSVSSKDPDSECRDSGVLPHPSSLDLTFFNRSDLEENLPSTSGSVQEPNNDVSYDCGYSFIAGVNSLAWGACGDSYNHNQDAPFKDLLFVSGSHGVIVHAFCHDDSTSEKSELIPEFQLGEGRWMEWGSRLKSGQSNAGDASCFNESFGEPVREKRTKEKVNGICVHSGTSDLSSTAPKRWLQSFLTKVETQELHGNIHVRFPLRSSFPHSAKIVSFHIFGDTFPSIESLANSHHVNNSEMDQVTVPTILDDSSAPSNPRSVSHQFKSAFLSKFVGVELNCSYTCSRVFSSNSHNLLGFVLSLVDLVPVTGSHDDESTRCRNFVLVARLDSWGLQYVSSVKHGEHDVDMHKVVEWVDFCFSDDLLVCLTASGLLSFYAVESGEFVRHLDILQCCGLGFNVNAHKKREMQGGAGVRDEQEKRTSGLSSPNNRRRFKKLMSASFTALLAAVDENGLTYVICAAEYLPVKCYSSMKLLPHCSHSEIGSFAGWEIGGSEIGHQLPYKWDSNDKLNHNDICRSGFSSSKMNKKRFQDLESPLKFKRSVLFPIGGFSEDDCLCFSPLGIIQLTKKRINGQYVYKIVHHNLQVDAEVHDDKCLNMQTELIHLKENEEVFVEAVGCNFQGCLYLVMQSGLSVVIPSILASSKLLHAESVGNRELSHGTSRGMGTMAKSKLSCSPWIIEVLDRCILYEEPEVADRLCSENGWHVRVSRLRRLQLLLEYLKFDEIEQSLEMLAGVGLAEEGILRMLFRAAYLMVGKVGSDNEVSAASRLLTLASSFATKLIRLYGSLQQKKNGCKLWDESDQLFSLLPFLSEEVQFGARTSKTLHEIAYFLEIIRGLQCRLVAKVQRPGQGLVDTGKGLSLVPMNLAVDESELSIIPADTLSLKASNHIEFTLSMPSSALGSSDAENLSLKPLDYVESRSKLDSDDFSEASALVPQVSPALEDNLRRNILPLENPSEMVARWKMDNLDLKTVVKDALLSGRLPLAVLQLHLHRSRDFHNEEEHRDTFDEVRVVGRAIAYDLFLKGETRLAVATLQRLGEDTKTSLKQLLFGTTRRSLRQQIAEEMERSGFLGPFDFKILERISLIERLYPSSSFWRTYTCQQEVFDVKDKASSQVSHDNTPPLLLSPIYNNMKIECGEVHGIVLGSWVSIASDSSMAVVCDDGANGGYWAAAAIWCSLWDQKTIDRIILDQPFLMGVHVLWDSQLEYHICHNDWEEVARLLDMIPSASLSDRNLQISLDGLQPSVVGYSRQTSFLGDYPSSFEELDAVYMDVPDIKIFRPSGVNLCSMWLKTFLEPELARHFIFLREYWEGTSDIVPLLARSGFVTRNFQCTLADGSSSPDIKSSTGSAACPLNSLHGLHKVLIRHCAQYGLPNLLDLYLDQHKLALDNDSLYPFLEAVGECQWARWLLFSRVKGQEYEASFSNSRAIMTRQSVASNLALETEELMQTIDDIAEGGGELAALATLIYTPIPIQNCLSTGSVKRQSTSAQCTLENLRPTMQHFPTLWRTFVAACLGQDPTYTSPLNKGINVFSSSTLLEYLNWRENIFCSADRDASLMQMLPCWFPKAVRRLVQLYSEGPLGWQSIGTGYLPHRDADFFINGEELSQISSVNWEEAIQRRIEEELYDSALKETGLGLEQHLHRGRALAAFNHLLGARIQKLKSERQSGASVNAQANVNSDVQTLLAPLIQSEESVLAPVMPLAVAHFENPVLVASCSFLLELCGFSTCMLRIDVAALRRISSFYKSIENNDNYKELFPKGSAFHAKSRGGDITESLARALADEYLQQDYPSVVNHKETSNPPLKRASRALMLVLQHLEKASLPSLLQGKTSGSWLFNGDGDGSELRSQQKAASQRWSLVTTFCQIHQIPLSTKYLAVLAKDNDWVGFLSEAQIGGYPFDVVVQVASKEFDDPRLKLHILTVMKSMQSRRRTGAFSYADETEKQTDASFSDEHLYIPVELFGILAGCEKKKLPGEALLVKAKDLSWSILAMIASCFSDVSPLDCLTVWLEITAARETSSIKVNDIASQIANNVVAAVESTNSLPACARVVTFHYNRKNSKRRRLMESIPVGVFGASGAEASSSHLGEGTFATQAINAGEETKVETGEDLNVGRETGEGPVALSKMVAVLCEQQLFLPLLRAFEMFLPSCSLLPFIRALQAFSQMRLSEASAHLGSFSVRIKEEPPHSLTSTGKEERVASSWISSTALKAADAVLSTCPSPYEKRCLLQLLAANDFGDGGHGSAHYRRLYWKINLAEPSLRKDNLHLGNETLDDASLLTALEKNGHWEQARNWARQLEASGGPWKSTVHHVTETQAESMVAEWREFLWDVPEERVSLWGHCQTLFIRYSFPPLQAGTFFLKQAEALEKDLPARELHDLLLLSLQWLSGMITMSQPVYPLHLLREIETRVWLLAVESEAQMKGEGDFTFSSSNNDNIVGYSSGMIDRTANIVTKMDNHITTMRNRGAEKNDARDNSQMHIKIQGLDSSIPISGAAGTKAKRRAKAATTRRPVADTVDKSTDLEDGFNNLNARVDWQPHNDNLEIELSFSKWEESVGPEELERAVLSLLEFGQISAAKQLQHKLSPTHIPSEFFLVDAAVKLAAVSTPWSKVPLSVLDSEVQSVIRSCGIPTNQHLVDPLEVLESLTATFTEGRGRGLFKRIIAVVKAANVLGLPFSEAFMKQPIEVLQLLSLKAQESFEAAKLLVQTHPMPAARIAKILAESFLKGLLAAHRGGYLDSQKEEGPAPLLWRFSDFLKWAELCPSEPEIGHALMRLVITGQEIPHTCEVELLILSHHYYKSSACLDGVDVLVALAANKVDAYVSEGDFACLARLITGVGNFHALHFILGILIENGQLNLLLQKYSAADAVHPDAGDVRGFRMAVLTTLKQFNPKDVDAFAMVYHHFVMKHETAALLEFRAVQASQMWLCRDDKDQNEDLLESMRLFIEAGEVYSSIDEGNNTRRACAQASLVSLQIRMPDFQWMNLSETNARRALVEQVRFPEALIVAEAYGLNQPSEWALVLWNQMLNPELVEEFMADFVGVLPLQPSMLIELARFYRAEMAARGDQSPFSLWLTGGGVPTEWAKYLARSFRCLLKKTQDQRLRLQMATIATGLGDIVDSCMKALDRVPENAGLLVLRRGHGGAYLPLM